MPFFRKVHLLYLFASLPIFNVDVSGMPLHILVSFEFMHTQCVLDTDLPNL